MPGTMVPLRPYGRGRRRLKSLALSAAVPLLAGACALSVGQVPPAATGFTFDTGSGLSFTIDSTNGNMTSLKHNGVELASGVAGQFESGWSSATVTAKHFDNGNSELITAVNGGAGVTQYYFARKGDNTVYLATDITRALDPGEARFISRLNDKILTNSPVAAKTAGATRTVEGKDVFAFPDGTTASKFYSSESFITQQPFGASGNGHGVFIVGGTHEMSSGGPFFRDIEVNDTGSAVNITHYMYSGHAQTEPLRLGLHGPYAMAVTNGSTAVPLPMEFLSAYVPGLLSASQRGTVTGTASGSWGGSTGTAALAGPNGQYWATVQNGVFTIGKVRPGTYTATLYAGELAVGSTASVTVSAGHTSTISLSGNAPASGTIFQLGAWDGTPAGFRNADRIERMHPSDVRMSDWNDGTTDVSAGAGVIPMAMFESVNSPLKLNFSLDSVPRNGARLRIGITVGFAGGRPAISVGGYTSPAGDSPPSVDLDSRSVTRGTWRGANQLYAFTIPASALRAGTNTLAISVLSGSTGTTYLSPAFVFDAIALDPA